MLSENNVTFKTYDFLRLAYVNMSRILQNGLYKNDEEIGKFVIRAETVISTVKKLVTQMKLTVIFCVASTIIC
jgi:hypothetical protein